MLGRNGLGTQLGGGSSVVDLGSAAAAKSEEHAELNEYGALGEPSGKTVLVARFTIAQIPTSSGLTYGTQGIIPVGDEARWVEGSCILDVGNYSTGQRQSVIAGALAVYHGTAHSGGVCG